MTTDLIRVELRPSPEAPRVARQMILDADPPHAMVDDLMLVASELVTNALKHGDPPLTMSLWSSADGVTVEVCDGAEDEPKVRTLERLDAAGGGRGLRIVDRLAAKWGVRADAYGKCVWAMVCPTII